MPDSVPHEVFYDLPDAEATDALAARFARAFAQWFCKAQDGSVAADTASGRSSHSAHSARAARAAGLQVQLHGDLGAGKTAFVRATLRALGYAGRVRSPTYTLVEPYQVVLEDSSSSTPLSMAVNHFDLYRFSSPDEWREAGFDEYLDQRALNLIEWPERATGLLGTPDLSLHIDVMGDGRRARAEALSEAGRNCLNVVAG